MDAYIFFGDPFGVRKDPQDANEILLQGFCIIL